MLAPLLLGFVTLLGPIHANSYVDLPATVRGRMEAVAVAAEFTVRSASARRVDGTFPVTDVVFEPVKDGDEEVSYTAILPGGEFEGRFEPGVPGAFVVAEGDTVYAMLEVAVGLRDTYLLYGVLERALLRKESTPYGDRMVSTTGRVLGDVDCDGAMYFLVETAECECDVEADAEDIADVAPCPETLIPVDEPAAWAPDWKDAVAALDACLAGVR